jgi:hypothetical protein
MGYAEERWVVVVATAGWLGSSLACVALALFGSALPWSARIFLGLYALLGIAMALHHSRHARAEAPVIASAWVARWVTSRRMPWRRARTRFWHPSQHSLRIHRGRRSSTAFLVTASDYVLQRTARMRRCRRIMGWRPRGR